MLPGKVVDLQVNYPTVVRLKLKLIGYEPGKYILLKHPDADGSKQHSDVLTEGNVVIVRYLLEGDKGECCAFRATISQITQFPQKMLVISYPVHIENRQLRLHQRVQTHLPAELTMDTESRDDTDLPVSGTARIRGIICDISERGCGFVFRSDSDKVTVKKLNVFISLKTPDGDAVQITGRVCNSRNEYGKVSVGIQFKEEPDKIKQLLEQLFILTNLM